MPSVISAGTTAGTAIAIAGDTTGNLAFQTNGTTTAMTITTSQNVGIGTTSPARILDIAAPNPGAGGGLRVTASTGTNGANMQVTNSGGNFYHAIDTSGGGSFGSAYSANIWYDGNYPMRFATNNQVQMIINGAGEFQMNSGYGSVAVAYGCRAWVNFDGQGTIAIRASGNVSSLTDNGTGNYYINFSTSMPDTNYSLSGATAWIAGVEPSGIVGQSNGTMETGRCGIVVLSNGSDTTVDLPRVYAVIHR